MLAECRAIGNITQHIYMRNHSQQHQPARGMSTLPTPLQYCAESTSWNKAREGNKSTYPYLHDDIQKRAQKFYQKTQKCGRHRINLCKSIAFLSHTPTRNIQLLEHSLPFSITSEHN